MGTKLFGMFMATCVIFIFCVCDGERWDKTPRPISPTQSLCGLSPEAGALEAWGYPGRVLKGDQIVQAEGEGNETS